MGLADACAPGGVPFHELVIASALGAIMGLLGFYITRALAPKVEAAIGQAGL